MNAKKKIGSLIKTTNMSNDEMKEKYKPLLDNFDGKGRIDIDENGNAILHYSFDNYYGARIKKDGDKWTIVTVRKRSNKMIGDDGPAIELKDWIVEGELKKIKDRMEDISKIK